MYYYCQWLGLLASLQHPRISYGGSDDNSALVRVLEIAVVGLPVGDYDVVVLYQRQSAPDNTCRWRVNVRAHLVIQEADLDDALDLAEAPGCLSGFHYSSQDIDKR